MRLFLATTALLSSATMSFAADRYHVVTPSFGCVLPWTTWVSNDQRSLAEHEPQWLQHVIDRGRCRLVSPIQEWQLIGSDGRLLLLRPLPPQDNMQPLLFRPSDLRRGQMKTMPTAPPATDAVVAPPIQAAPAGASDSVVAQPLPPIGPSPSQAPAASTAPPPAIPAAAPGRDLAASAPPPAPMQAHDPVPVPVPVPAPVPVAAPAPLPAPSPVPSPVASKPLPPVPAGRTAPHHGARHTASSHPSGLVIGVIALVLASLAVLAWAAGGRLAMRRRSRPVAARPDRLQATGVADIEPVPPRIDRDGYRRRCIDFLAEGGWKARPCFPGSGLTPDIMARRDGRLLTVQCRPSTQPLEVTVVREALVVRAAQDAALAAVVSNAGYTKAARSLAAASGVLLLHETELPELVS